MISEEGSVFAPSATLSAVSIASVRLARNVRNRHFDCPTVTNGWFAPYVRQRSFQHVKMRSSVRTRAGNGNTDFGRGLAGTSGIRPLEVDRCAEYRTGRQRRFKNSPRHQPFNYCLQLIPAERTRNPAVVECRSILVPHCPVGTGYQSPGKRSPTWRKKHGALVAALS